MRLTTVVISCSRFSQMGHNLNSKELFPLNITELESPKVVFNKTFVFFYYYNIIYIICIIILLLIVTKVFIKQKMVLLTLLNMLN